MNSSAWYEKSEYNLFTSMGEPPSNVSEAYESRKDRTLITEEPGHGFQYDSDASWWDLFTVYIARVQFDKVNTILRINQIAKYGQTEDGQQLGVEYLVESLGTVYDSFLSTLPRDRRM